MGPALELTPSPHCVFEKVTPAHFEKAHQVFHENEETLFLLGPGYESDTLTHELVTCSGLPPGGVQQNVLNTIVTCRETGETLGVLELYRGYPTEDALYIGGLFLRPSWQGKGVGAEMVEHLKGVALRAGYRMIYAAVGMKNWPALRFWLAVGFSRVTKISGDGTFGESRFAIMELVHDLAAS